MKRSISLTTTSTGVPAIVPRTKSPPRARSPLGQLARHSPLFASAFDHDDTSSEATSVPELQLEELAVFGELEYVEIRKRMSELENTSAKLAEENALLKRVIDQQLEQIQQLNETCSDLNQSIVVLKTAVSVQDHALSESQSRLSLLNDTNAVVEDDVQPKTPADIPRMSSSESTLNCPANHSGMSAAEIHTKHLKTYKASQASKVTEQS
ncbi:hypothetical protein BZG36_00215 [Bifiguratus adelaidae]|uniref:Uncharacterized protein n=1 Tax=Bifiguratus adelaidae TaxID=1938954 RepID=A0A261Y8C2_9FUNG|nr:hypothetical protein BZG36_00215 [Bifiguratus adelaidae]